MKVPELESSVMGCLKVGIKLYLNKSGEPDVTKFEVKSVWYATRVEKRIGIVSRITSVGKGCIFRPNNSDFKYIRPGKHLHHISMISKKLVIFNTTARYGEDRPIDSSEPGHFREKMRKETSSQFLIVLVQQLTVGSKVGGHNNSRVSTTENAGFKLNLVAGIENRYARSMIVKLKSFQ
ncbi:hypothetical protein L873DRAFT_1923275 [Choiromyces venosus 120613-1]|uniref:Uncharacterized protein n=1 Tax=Choiromyces venosus 120613-1 TaxID=1336337 RepID=A0A3N4JF73_9PEZI|nr:hypothetical protein L873DRAFT_1923275 [Choiromyces venosus 120613-1]